MIHNETRVATIREKTAAELSAIADLEAMVKNEYLRNRLAFARNVVRDVETFFLSKLERETMSAAAEARWLSHAELHLNIASQQRISIQQLVDQYGPDLVTIG